MIDSHPAWALPSVLLLGAGVLLMTGVPAHAEYQTPTVSVQDTVGVIQVTGNAELHVLPDRATLTFIVEEEASAADTAHIRNAARMNAVYSALRRVDANGATIETESYTLQPRYGAVGPGRDRAIVGYVARNRIRVTSDDVDAVGRLVDAGIEAGANRVTGPVYEIQDPGPHRHQVLRDAVRDALREADAIAEGLQVRLGAVLRVEGRSRIPEPEGPLPRALMPETVPDPATETPLTPGLVRVTAAVTLHIRIASETP